MNRNPNWNFTATIYARVSSPSQANNNSDNVEEGLSIDTQIQECRNYASNKGYRVTNTVTEVGTSFRVRTKSKLNELVNAMESDKNMQSDVIIVYSFDRFSRNLIHGLELLDRLKNKNIFVESVLEPGVDYTLPAGRHQITGIISLAQMQSENISLRVKKAYQRKRELGIPIKTNRNVTYGFRYDQDGNLIKDTEEQVVVHFITALREGTLTSARLSELLYTILPERNRVPIKFYEEDRKTGEEEEIEVLKPSEMSFDEIAELLNSYETLRRGKLWTKNSVKRVYTTTGINLEKKGNIENQIDSLINKLSNTNLSGKKKSKEINKQTNKRKPVEEQNKERSDRKSKRDKVDVTQLEQPKNRRERRALLKQQGLLGRKKKNQTVKQLKTPTQKKQKIVKTKAPTKRKSTNKNYEQMETQLNNYHQMIDNVNRDVDGDVVDI
jgi:DNA invertase Pin-like site-specific DNA recombinase